MEWSMWGDGETLGPDVARAGRAVEYREALKTIGASTESDIREWAATELKK